MRLSAVLTIGVLFFAGLMRSQGPPRITSQKDVVYGVTDGVGLLADVSWPVNRTSVPAIVMVHGGRWRSGSKNDTRYGRADVWASAGFFAMNIDYHLVNGTPAPACYQDLFTAIRWLHAHATTYNIDTSRVYLLGRFFRRA